MIKPPEYRQPWEEELINSQSSNLLGDERRGKGLHGEKERDIGYQ
jgi:hypothetical protein